MMEHFPNHRDTIVFVHVSFGVTLWFAVLEAQTASTNQTQLQSIFKHIVGFYATWTLGLCYALIK